MNYDRATALEKCRSKNWYESPREAIAAIAKAPATARCEKLYYYSCQMCSLFHLTSKEPDKARHKYFKFMEKTYRQQVRKSHGQNEEG